MLKSLTPSEHLFRVASGMFKELWEGRASRARSNATALAAELASVEARVSGLIDRVVNATVPSVISAYENSIKKLEEEKLVLKERMASAGRPVSSFETTARTALSFLANPWLLWSSGKLEQRRMVVRLAFADRLTYVRNSGYRTADLALPFKLLADLSRNESRMVPGTGMPVFRDFNGLAES